MDRFSNQISHLSQSMRISMNLGLKSEMLDRTKRMQRPSEHPKPFQLFLCRVNNAVC